MAIVVQTINAISSYVPYERPPQPATLWTAIPRGLHSFIIDGQQVDLKPVNDDFILEMKGTLDPNYGWVMAYATLSVTQDRAADWDNECNLNLQNFYRSPQNLGVATTGNWVQPFEANSLNLSSRAMTVRGLWPSFPMVAPSGTSGILINFTAWNGNNTAASAGIVNFIIAFWQFDLEQVRKHPINSPVPVQLR